MSDEKLNEVTHRNIREMLVEKAHELFKVCDKEDKGIVMKHDMQHLIGELPLSADQLEIVFDSLDKDGNGFLTIQEFTDGFGMFLGIDTTPAKVKRRGYSSVHDMDQPLDDIEEEDMEDCGDAFDNLLNQLGGRDLIREEENVRQIWIHLKEVNAVICRKFEDVLGKLIQEIKASKMENIDLESALKSRMIQHDEEVTQLYEEMERQISAEKESLLAEERAKERKLREELEKELSIKEKTLQELLTKQSEMEKRLSEITSTGSETKQENAKLQKERDALEQRLQKSECLVKEMQRHLEGIRQETLQDKRRRAKATLQVTEGIALERESLVRELDVLRSANKRLLDEKDFLNSSLGSKTENDEEELELNTLDRCQEDNTSSTSAALTSTPRGTLVKQGSVLSDYFGSSPGTPRTTSLYSGVSCDDKELIEIEEEEEITIEGNCEVAKWINSKNNQEENTKEKSCPDTGEKQEANENRITEETDTLLTPKNICAFKGKHGGQVIWKVKCIVYPEAITDTHETCKTRNEWKTKKVYHSFCDGEARRFVPEKEEFIKMKRSICQSLSNSSQGQERNAQHYWKVNLTVLPAFMHIIPLSEDDFTKEEVDHLYNEKTQTPVSPERVFKIVFIGDSGVGKSSFIQRFCHNQFRPHYSATVGVDFQVKSVEVGGRTIALQFWDTAGQERFRSITKQYYRKADGIIVMYDITSEASFRSVREWINSIKDNTSDAAVMLFVGNKFDLCRENDNRMVKEKDGRQLAQEFGALFYETSSCTGHHVEDSVMEMASLLQVKEDEELDRVLKLQEVAKKNKCC